MIEIASIRLALIQPAFNGTYPDATKKKYYVRISQKLYVDYGSPYKNEQLAMICGQLGTVLIHTPVSDGARKAKKREILEP